MPGRTGVRRLLQCSTQPINYRCTSSCVSCTPDICTLHALCAPPQRRGFCTLVLFILNSSYNLFTFTYIAQTTSHTLHSHSHTLTHSHSHSHTLTHPHPHTSTHTHIHTYTPTYTPTHPHPHPHTHTHTHTP